MPFVRQQPLDGSGPEACCSCTRVHGIQRRWLAKLPWHQFGNGCSLCNGAGLCSAPGEAFFQSKSFVAKESMSAVSVPYFRAFTRCQFSPQWVLQILGFAPSPFSWPVCWCLCLPSVSQFTVAPCHVLITCGLFVSLAGVTLRSLPRFIVLLAPCTPCWKAASVWCLMQVKSSMLLLSQTLKIIRWICCKVFASSAWH